MSMSGSLGFCKKTGKHHQQDTDCEKMVSKYSSVNSSVSSKIHHDENSEENMQSSHSSANTESSGQSISDRSAQIKTFSRKVDERWVSSELKTFECRDLNHGEKETYNNSSCGEDGGSSPFGKERGKSQVKNVHRSQKDRHHVSHKSVALHSHQKTHRFSLDSRLDERPQKPSFSRCDSLESTQKVSTTKRDASKSPSSLPSVSFSEKANRDEKSVGRLSSPNLKERTYRHHSEDSRPKHSSHFKKDSQGGLSSPCSRNSQHSQSGESPKVSRHCHISPEYRQEREPASDLSEVSDSSEEQSEKVVKDGVPKHASHGRKSRSAESVPFPVSPHGFHKSSPQSTSHESGELERHVGYPRNKPTPPRKHINSCDQSSSGHVSKRNDQIHSPSHQSSYSSDRHKDSDSDKRAFPESADNGTEAGKAKSSSDGHASLGTGHHQSKSGHSSRSNERRASSHSDRGSSHSDRRGSTPSVIHSSKNVDGNVLRKNSNSRDRQGSGDRSSKSPHNRHSDGHIGVSKDTGGLLSTSEKQESDGNELNKCVSIQATDDSHSRHRSHLSPKSDEDGCIMEVSISTGDITDPDLQSEKEDKNSEKHSSPNAHKEDKKRHSVCDTDTREKHYSKSDGSVIINRRHSNSEGHSSSGHRSPRATSSRKRSFEIKPISIIVDETCGYITSPDISSEEEDDDEKQEKSTKKRSVSAKVERRESTNSQTEDEVGPVALAKHQLKPSMDRHGGSYAERLKVIEKLMAVKQKMDENEQGYHRKRAARGEVKKRRARREKLEGDFSGPCRDKIEYNIEDKPSLKRPEPKPEEPKPEKPKKEKKEKPKRDPSQSKEKRKPKQVVKDRSKRGSRDSSTDIKKRAPKLEKKRRARSVSNFGEDHDKKAKHSRKEISRTSSLGQESNYSSDVSDAMQREFLRMKSVWNAVFAKSKESSETPAEPAPESAPEPAPEPASEMDAISPAPEERSTVEDEKEESEEDMDWDNMNHHLHIFA